MGVIETDGPNAISDANRSDVSRFIREAEEGRDRVVLRSNNPVAVVMGVDRFEHLQQLQDDLIDITLLASWMMTGNDRCSALDEVLEQFGCSREDLANLPDSMPIRAELPADARDDLARYANTGDLPLFWMELPWLEAVDKGAGVPLGRSLVDFRTNVVGKGD